MTLWHFPDIRGGWLPIPPLPNATNAQRAAWLHNLGFRVRLMEADVLETPTEQREEAKR